MSQQLPETPDQSKESALNAELVLTIPLAGIVFFATLIWIYTSTNWLTSHDDILALMGVLLMFGSYFVSAAVFYWLFRLIGKRIRKSSGV